MTLCFIFSLTLRPLPLISVWEGDLISLNQSVQTEVPESNVDTDTPVTRCGGKLKKQRCQVTVRGRVDVERSACLIYSARHFCY